MVSIQTQTALPAIGEIKAKSQWVCWCYEETKDGRLTKVPYNARNGYKASSTNPKHWVNYELVLKALKNGRNASGKQYDGVGFVFNEDYTGIDLDHCINEDGQVDEWAQIWLDHLNTYAEISPSGTGIHAYARGLIPPTPNARGEMVRQGKKVHVSNQRDKQAAIEMYSVGRFFTVSSNHLPTTPTSIEDRQEEVEVLYEHLSQTNEQPIQKLAPREQVITPDNLSDAELIKKAMEAKNGSNFQALWNGDKHAYNNDHSSADQALCNLLAFWTNKDAFRMDRLFRQSRLYREKWDRNARNGETYGQGTIARAIDNCNETYSARTSGDKSIRVDPSSEQKTTNGRYTFIIEGQLREQVQKALHILKNANDSNPKIFIYLSSVSKVTYDEMNNPIIMQVERAALRNILNDAADFFAWKKKNEAAVLVEAHPPKDLADQILALAPSEWPFPALKAIVEAPVLRPDGSILDRPGYDAKTHLYYVPSPGMEKCKIPTNPTKDDVSKAMDFIKGIFVDFPFEGPSDLANAIGLLFTPFVRYAVKKDIQMALIDATNAGTGKGLITIVVSIAATGKTTTPMTAKRDDEEWRKAILTELLQAPRIVIIDNIRGVLESTTLELMLTGNGINERILGQSKSAKPKNEATWMATGNNLLIGGDLPRRCYRIRLISPTATPEERDGFKIKDLEQWAIDHRAEIVTAILTVARAWYVAGKPQPKKVPNLGTFTDWAKTIGGILEFAGVDGFQGNRDELRSRNNEEAQEWEAFLSTWFKTYGEVWKSASDIADDIKKANEFLTQPTANTNEPPASMLLKTLPHYLKSALAEKPKSFSVILPIQLGKRVQTVYGTDAYRIEKDEDSHTKIKVWKVSRGVAGGSNSQRRENNFEEKKEILSGIVNRRNNPPQPPANTYCEQEINSQKSSSNGSTGYVVDNQTAINVAGGYSALAGGYDEKHSCGCGKPGVIIHPVGDECFCEGCYSKYFAVEYAQWKNQNK